MVKKAHKSGPINKVVGGKLKFPISILPPLKLLSRVVVPDENILKKENAIDDESGV